MAKFPMYLFKRDIFTALTMDVKVSTEKPPCFDNLVVWLGFIPATAIFTYGDTIYNPNNVKLSDQLIVHEQVHMKQQGFNDADAALWWGKFMRDEKFRIDQEAEAYAEQYAFLCHYIKAKQQRFDLLMQLSRILAGPLYGHAVPYVEAMGLIRNRSGVK